MLFINKHRKAISMVAVLTFFCFIQLAAMPLPAATSEDEAPAMVEKAATTSSYSSGGGSMLTWVLIGVGVVAVGLALYFFVLKTSYDITGDWDLDVDNGAFLQVNTFTGTKKTGTWTEDTGYVVKNSSYTVDGKNVTWTGIRYLANGTTYWSTDTFTGTFSDKSTMSGTYNTSWSGGTKSGTWKATKGTTAT